MGVPLQGASRVEKEQPGGHELGAANTAQLDGVPVQAPLAFQLHPGTAAQAPDVVWALQGKGEPRHKPLVGAPQPSTLEQLLPVWLQTCAQVVPVQRSATPLSGPASGWFASPAPALPPPPASSWLCPASPPAPPRLPALVPHPLTRQPNSTSATTTQDRPMVALKEATSRPALVSRTLVRSRYRRRLSAAAAGAR